MMKQLVFSVAITTVWLGTCAALGAEGPAAAPPRNPFYASVFEVNDPRYPTLTDWLGLLHKLGYEGYGRFNIDGLPEVLQALDANHLELYHVFTPVWLDPTRGPKIDPKLDNAIALLKGRETVICVPIIGKPASAKEWDPEVVQIVRTIAEKAAPARLRVAIYPHEGHYTERVEDAVRIVKEVDRKNVGVVFNEVHFLLVDDERNLQSALRTAMPYLLLVNINGADSGAKENTLTRENLLPRLLQPLDQGSFDVRRVLRPLRQMGYAGPVGLFCYQLKGDMPDNLARGMRTWKRLMAELGANNPAGGH